MIKSVKCGSRMHSDSFGLPLRTVVVCSRAQHTVVCTSCGMPQDEPTSAKGVHSDRPVFHVMPRDGWLNDPNGPIFYDGLYHIFYQHVVGSSSWQWGLVWGHASSPDLVRWEHQPVAIQPSARSYDADGCWSGNVAVELDGTPTMLYTGVRLREKESNILPPPQDLDLGLEQIEVQCAASCLPGDKKLLRWEKGRKPIIQAPPSDLGALTGFRDPFVFARKTDVSPWKLIVGSGRKGRGGTILLYHSDRLTQGWEYKGPLVSGDSKPCEDGAGYDLGAMWECPFFVQLQQYEGGGDSPLWMLCVSPYPHFRKDRPTNPCLYWLGTFQHDTFRLDEAQGPKLLDLGDALYAPTLFAGCQQTIMVAWLQELRKGGSWDYAGCLSAPRVLSFQDGRLRQDPVPQISELRVGRVISDIAIEVSESQSLPLVGSEGATLDIELTFNRLQSNATGLLLRSWLKEAQEGTPCTEALMIDWKSQELVVVAPKLLVPNTLKFDVEDVVKRIGGRIFLPEGQQRLKLRILKDHSLIEVFTEFGQVLTTRVYCESAPKSADSRLYFFSSGGSSSLQLHRISALDTIWPKSEDIPAAATVYP